MAFSHPSCWSMTGSVEADYNEALEYVQDQFPDNVFTHWTREAVCDFAIITRRNEESTMRNGLLRIYTPEAFENEHPDMIGEEDDDADDPFDDYDDDDDDDDDDNDDNNDKTDHKTGTKSDDKKEPQKGESSEKPKA